MSIDDRKHAYMKRMLGMTVLFAALGSVVLYFGINHLSNVLTSALEKPGKTAGSK
ncbi:MAG TPA: hypothetical protein PKN86_02030 [Candidatus Obscuribacter sp.]|jgi:hypothetical protein|nr:hypothetical protein [Candidatus Melainabacteria bacterium]MBK8221090.1 hypothetical protein [Candidatus Obscuribacter sp.]MBK9279685.1 hypothetical protein [Candidatus Obscuribacter sp.]MBL8081761.1 hypothetical protein [Candidatus Obscuribacter sp.]HMW89556.1 hypothetical protein [Candidatus Obscuribacter sp.]